MIKRRFVAKDAKRAMAMIQNTLGLNAVIFSNRRVPEGVEIIAGLEEENEVARNEGHANIFVEPDTRVINTAVPLQHTPENDPAFNKMHQEIQLLRSLLEGQLVQSLSKKMQQGDAKHILLRQGLIHQGLSPEFAEELLKEASEQTSIMDAWEKIYEALVNRISTPEKEIIENQHCIALVGATGVGKTTTLAKLATRFVLNHHPEELGLITTDFNRVAAQGQLLLYGQILGVETKTVHKEEDLKNALINFQTKKLILIDTAGVSQRDSLNIARLLSMFNQTTQLIQIYLAMSCTSQPVVLEEIIETFKAVSLAGTILTKADEVPSIIPALGTLIQQRLTIAYITHGQRIPQDIQVAEKYRLAKLILDTHKMSQQLIKANQGLATLEG